MSGNDLLEYRVDRLEKQFIDLLKLMQETHDAVTQIEARMGKEPFQCGIHAEKIAAFEKRLSNVEDTQSDAKKDDDKIKKWVYQVSGGLIVVNLIFSCVIAPLVVGSFSKKESIARTITIPGTTNTFTIK